MVLSFSRDNKRRMIILDGGLGTTLEDVYGCDIAHPLWSARLVDEDPETIVQAHLGFLTAGARIILTSTYQCSFETFSRAGYTHDGARSLMLKCVDLANVAVTRYLEERPDITRRDIMIALSLGPYGAACVPAQEYDGCYPPPYGPQAYSAAGKNRNAFTMVELHAGDEERAIVALESFHRERLEVFLADGRAWGLVDCVAFETVPVEREIRAIRRAMGKLGEAGGARPLKPWWISALFPQGRYPQQMGAGRDDVASMVEAMLSPELGGHMPVPTGIGVNCTATEFLPEILQEAERAMTSNWKREAEVGGVERDRLWLVLYPNGGDVYDPQAQTWAAAETKGKPKEEAWTEEVVTALDGIDEDQWGGFIIGGCCKTGFDDIRALNVKLADRSRRSPDCC